MGDAPGVQTEFWEWAALDFCGDLYHWSEAILAEENPPHVHSISYGLQGPLSALQCASGQSAAVDDNLAKLAARGITVVVSSGDSGAGYIAGHDFFECSAAVPGEVGVGVSGGKVTHTTRGTSAQDCCQGTQEVLPGTEPTSWTFTFTTPLGPFTNSTDYEFTNASGVFHTLSDARHPLFHRPLWRKGDVLYLHGVLDATGGNVTVHSANGTFADATLTFGVPKRMIDPSPFGPATVFIRRSVNGTFGSPKAAAVGGGSAGPTPLYGYADFNNVTGGAHPGAFEVTRIVWYSDADQDTDVGDWWPPTSRSREGTCTYYQGGVRATANATTVTAFLPPPTPAALWPSWPASSPWVTAVGGTSFDGNIAGAKEVATTQFGSGGGFSQIWDRTHATWQEVAVQAYLSIPGASPPAGLFPPNGRATPDLSALGEGYQVRTRPSACAVAAVPSRGHYSES